MSMATTTTSEPARTRAESDGAILARSIEGREVNFQVKYKF